MKTKLLLIAAIVFCKTISAQVWTNGQNAIYTLGSTSPSASGTINPTSNTFGPTVTNVCFAIDPKHNCAYVADFFSHRVLRFAYPITSNLPTANLVIGQSNFTNSTSGGLTQSGLVYPNGLALDTASGTLWVLSQGQNRILRFDNAYTITVNNPNANQVLGQPNFTSGGASVTQSGLSFNTGPQCANQLHYDQLTGALWVSDNGNIRVLRYDNAKTIGNGANANAVLGQSLYTTNATGLTSTTYGRPDGLTTIGTSLFVADPNNNRVLRYDNVYSKPNGAAADAVYGQINFTSNTPATSATGLNQPTGLTSDQSNLYVAELTNKRILIYNSALTNTVANNVLLSTNLTTAGPGTLSPSTGGANACITFDPVYNQLLVEDRSNNRVLVFQPCSTLSISSPSAVCNGSSIILNALGATSYTWSNAATTSSISVSPTVTTVYSFTGTTGACSSTATKTIVVNALPSLTVTSSASLICSGNSATLTSAGANTYTWNTASTNTSISVSPTVTTTYTVTGTNTSGCSNNTSITQSVSLCTGITNSAINNNLFLVYPNPNSGNFVLQLSKSSEIIIYNILGEIILKESYAEGNQVINISNANNGIYFVKAIENGRSQIIKVIKQ